MKYFQFTSLMLLSLLYSCGFFQQRTDQDISNIPKSIYEFKINTLSGVELDFNTLKGKRILIVNTASKCGYTPQYEELENLHKTYGGDKFIIIGFPANDFGSQEPGSNKDIQEFCQKNFGVSFPMSQKISVKGDDISPLYKWLTLKELNSVSDADVKWNFNKFLIDENGKWVAWLDSKAKPTDERILNFIQTGKISQ